MAQRGRFISLEGGEGVGKSTQVRALAAALRERGLDVVETREPGGSDGAEAIRKLLLEGEAERWNARAEAALFAAARSDHIERTIAPALDAGRWVVSDRFVDSSLAYQGGAGTIGMRAIRDLHGIVCEGFLPDRTLILLAPDGAQRAQERDGGAGDRIGARSAGYHRSVEQAFRQIADDEPARVRLIDASGAPETVTARLLGAIADLLP